MIHRYVIVGAGPAGVIAAETLRTTDPDADITLIGDEPERPYSRMAIPYLLTEKIGEDGTHLRKGHDHYDSKGIRVLRDRVEHVDAQKKRLTLKSGGAMDYDKLLVCTGSRAVRPPVPGFDLPGVHTCWTLEDARNIARLAEKGAKVVLVGAGFAAALAAGLGKPARPASCSTRRWAPMRERATSTCASRARPRPNSRRWASTAGARPGPGAS